MTCKENPRTQRKWCWWERAFPSDSLGNAMWWCSGEEHRAAVIPIHQSPKVHRICPQEGSHGILKKTWVAKYLSWLNSILFSYILVISSLTAPREGLIFPDLTQNLVWLCVCVYNFFSKNGWKFSWSLEVFFIQVNKVVWDLPTVFSAWSVLCLET